MNYAALIFYLGKNSLECLTESGETICADDHDLLHSPALESIATFEAVYFPDLLGDLPGRHATSVHR